MAMTKPQRAAATTAGIGAALAALGLAVVFIGSASFEPKTIEAGYVLVGFGAFIALTVASVFLVTRR